ncbi:MAG: serine hydrolase [Bacteroidota bacterium]
MRKSTLFVFILSLLSLSCGVQQPEYDYQQPEKINDGLEVGTLEEVGIDSRYIGDAVRDIDRGKYGEIHALLVCKDGKLALEEYFEGHKYQWEAPRHHGEWISWKKEMLHDIKSVSKSITSACIGITIDKGFIESVHQSIFDYLPDHQHLKTGGKEKITIEHMLTMTSGLEWDEWGVPLSSAKNDIIGLWFHCDDQIECILERPLVSEPGSSFTYSGGNTIVLGEIIKNATQLDIEEFSKKYLFEPLDVDTCSWSVRYPSGIIESGGGLDITPRAMLKVGVTFLNHGVWNGKQVVSEEWVDKSALSFPPNRRINVPGEDTGRNGYSYSWWINDINISGKKTSIFYGSGWGGQKIIVMPGQNAVIVFTGGNYTSKVKEFKILKRYIIPAFENG